MREKLELPAKRRERLGDYDYAILMFERTREAYRAENQFISFKLVQTGLLDAQVQIHVKMHRAVDEKRGKERDIDLDVYLPIEVFRRARNLLDGLRFRRDRFGRRVPIPVKRRGRRRS